MTEEKEAAAGIAAAPQAEKRELSRLEKLEAKMAQVKRQLALERRKESERARKERTHRLIRRGGLVEMVLGEEVDAGLLVGVLLQHKHLFAPAAGADGTGAARSGEAYELKCRGDRLIAAREAAREKAKGGGKKDAGTEHIGAGSGGAESAGAAAPGAGGAG